MVATPPAPHADVPALQAFLAVARAGTVARAAMLLGRTQPAISARLAALEAGWGTTLFRRLPRGMRLTPEGARLLPLAETALRGLEALDRQAGVPLAPPAALRVGAGDALGRRLLPRALAGLLAERPELEVHVREGPGPKLLDLLAGGAIDVALVVQPERVPAGVRLEPLACSPVELLVPAAGTGRRRDREARGVRNAPGALPRRPGPQALARRRLVALQPGSAFRSHLERAFAAAGVDFRPAVEVGNLSLVRRFVAAGLGMAPVPAVAFDPQRVPPGVTRRPMRGIPPVTYHRAVREGVPSPAAADRLAALLGGEEGDGPG